MIDLPLLGSCRPAEGYNSNDMLYIYRLSLRGCPLLFTMVAYAFRPLELPPAATRARAREVARRRDSIVPRTCGTLIATMSPLRAHSHVAWRAVGFGLARPAPAAIVSRLSTKARPPSQVANGMNPPAVESFSEGFDRGNEAYLGRSSDGGDDGRIVIPWVTVGATAAVIGAYAAYFYLVEQPSLPPDPEPSLASEVVRLLPDGRMLMKDGSIQAVLPQSSEGFVAAPSFQGLRAGMCFKKGPAGIGYYMDEPLHKRLPQSAPPA